MVILVEALSNVTETVERHLEGLGSHSLVNYTSEMHNLHDALYLELSQLIGQYKQAVNILEMMSLVSKSVASSSSTPASPVGPSSPVKAKKMSPALLRKKGQTEALNHQKLLEVTCEDVQQRLYKNKGLLVILLFVFSYVDSLLLFLSIPKCYRAFFQNGQPRGFVRVSV